MQGEDIENRGGEKPNRANESGPVEDTERGWTSWLIQAFVVVNVILFVIVMWFNNCPKHINNTGDGYGGGKCVARFLGRVSFQPMKENPLLGPSSATLQRLGALNWYKVVHEHKGWRLISCIWLHAGLIHLLVNMLSLVFIGIRLEQQFGFLRIGLIYLVSGLGGSILSSLFIRDRVSVGASGALFGLLGAMMAELITNSSIYTNKCAAFCSLLLIVVLNLGIGILPRVGNFANIGGFLTGLLLGFILLARPQFGWIKRHKRPAGVHGRSKYKFYQYVLMVLSAILLVTGLTVGLVMLLRGENGYDHCKWCHYLSCVPTSRWKCDK